MKTRFKILLVGSSYNVGLNFKYTRLAIKLKNLGNDVCIIYNGKLQHDKLLAELKMVGIPCYPCNSLDEASFIRIIKGAEEIRKIISLEGTFDFILGGGIREAPRVFLATRNNHEKSFSLVGSLPQDRLSLWLAFISYELLCDMNIALCNYTKNQLIKINVSPSKTCVIPLFAPDLEWFDEAKNRKLDLEKYGLQDITRPVIFYAARQDEYKGFEYYLKAASKVLEKSDATFIIGGVGPITPYLKKLAEKLGITRNVFFTGWISSYHMPYVLSNTVDICISSSLIEQLPTYILECMAAGKPVVASNVGGVSEVVQDGINGYLVPPRDYKETALRIIDLLNDQEKARKMGQTGRKMIEEQLNMRISISRLVEMVKGELE
ncbi:MAG: glycosyltransferase family 4 protein [Thermoproteota archaeon]